MNVLILGATGTFGKVLTSELSKNTSHNITAFSRHSSEMYGQNNNVKAVEGDALNIADLSIAIKGQDVVFCAISGENLPKIAENIKAVMENENVSRLIFMGATGIYNEIPVEMDDDDNLDNEPAQIPNRKAVDIIENSNLNYTILRPGYLRNGDKNDFVLTFKGEKAKGYISTISSVVALSTCLINDSKLYSRESVGITKDMRKSS